MGRNKLVPKSSQRHHECLFCNRLFLKYVQLENHMSTHTKEQPHQCDKCDRSFSIFKSLWEHNKVYHLGQPWKCQYCSKQFNSTSSFSSHKKTHHVEETEEHRKRREEEPEVSSAINTAVWKAISVQSSQTGEQGGEGDKQQQGIKLKLKLDITPPPPPSKKINKKTDNNGKDEEDEEIPKKKVKLVVNNKKKKKSSNNLPQVKEKRIWTCEICGKVFFRHDNYSLKRHLGTVHRDLTTPSSANVYSYSQPPAAQQEDVEVALPPPNVVVVTLDETPQSPPLSVNLPNKTDDEENMEEEENVVEMPSTSSTAVNNNNIDGGLQNKKMKKKRKEKRIWKCMICGKQFFREDSYSLRRHINTVHCNFKKNKSKPSDKNSALLQEAVALAPQRNPQPPEVEQVEVVELEEEQQEEIQIEQLEDLESDFQRQTIKTDDNNSLFLLSKKTGGNQVRLWTCKFCGKRFHCKSRFNLTRHILRVHNNNGNNSKKRKKQQKLLKMENSTKPKKVKISLNTAKKKNKNRKSEMPVKSNNKIVEKITSLKNNSNYHLNGRSGCPICGKVFSRVDQYSVNRHIKRVHRDLLEESEDEQEEGNINLSSASTSRKQEKEDDSEHSSWDFSAAEEAEEQVEEDIDEEQVASTSTEETPQPPSTEPPPDFNFHPPYKFFEIPAARPLEKSWDPSFFLHMNRYKPEDAADSNSCVAQSSSSSCAIPQKVSREEEIEESYECPKCGRVLASKTSFKRHEKVENCLILKQMQENPVSALRYICAFCGKDFADRRGNLVRHIAGIHRFCQDDQSFQVAMDAAGGGRKKKDYSCAFCAVTSQYKDEIKDHILEIHAHLLGTPKGGGGVRAYNEMRQETSTPQALVFAKKSTPEEYTKGQVEIEDTTTATTNEILSAPLTTSPTRPSTNQLPAATSDYEIMADTVEETVQVSVSQEPTTESIILLPQVPQQTTNQSSSFQVDASSPPPPPSCLPPEPDSDSLPLSQAIYVELETSQEDDGSISSSSSSAGSSLIEVTGEEGSLSSPIPLSPACLPSPVSCLSSVQETNAQSCSVPGTSTKESSSPTDTPIITTFPLLVTPESQQPIPISPPPPVTSENQIRVQALQLPCVEQDELSKILATTAIEELQPIIIMQSLSSPPPQFTFQKVKTEEEEEEEAPAPLPPRAEEVVEEEHPDDVQCVDYYEEEDTQPITQFVVDSQRSTQEMLLDSISSTTTTFPSQESVDYSIHPAIIMLRLESERDDIPSNCTSDSDITEPPSLSSVVCESEGETVEDDAMSPAIPEIHGAMAVESQTLDYLLLDGPTCSTKAEEKTTSPTPLPPPPPPPIQVERPSFENRERPSSSSSAFPVPCCAERVILESTCPVIAPVQRENSSLVNFETEVETIIEALLPLVSRFQFPAEPKMSYPHNPMPLFPVSPPTEATSISPTASICGVRPPIESAFEVTSVVNQSPQLNILGAIKDEREMMDSTSHQTSNLPLSHIVSKVEQICIGIPSVSPPNNEMESPAANSLESSSSPLSPKELEMEHSFPPLLSPTSPLVLNLDDSSRVQSSPVLPLSPTTEVDSSMDNTNYSITPATPILAAAEVADVDQSSHMNSFEVVKSQVEEEKEKEITPSPPNDDVGTVETCATNSPLSFVKDSEELSSPLPNIQELEIEDSPPLTSPKSPLELDRNESLQVSMNNTECSSNGIKETIRKHIVDHHNELIMPRPDEDPPPPVLERIEELNLRVDGGNLEEDLPPPILIPEINNWKPTWKTKAGKMTFCSCLFCHKSVLKSAMMRHVAALHRYQGDEKEVINSSSDAAGPYYSCAFCGEASSQIRQIELHISNYHRQLAVSKPCSKLGKDEDKLEAGVDNDTQTEKLEVENYNLETDDENNTPADNLTAEDDNNTPADYLTAEEENLETEDDNNTPADYLSAEDEKLETGDDNNTPADYLSAEDDNNTPADYLTAEDEDENLETEDDNKTPADNLSAEDENFETEDDNNTPADNLSAEDENFETGDGDDNNTPADNLRVEPKLKPKISTLSSRDCKKCKKRFSSKKRLEEHYKKVRKCRQAADNFYACQFCGKYFDVTRGHLVRHIVSVHCKKGEWYTCGFCGEDSMSMLTVAQHIRTNHKPNLRID